jgi:membrane protease YdiL (CAAX protease family)
VLKLRNFLRGPLGVAAQLALVLGTMLLAALPGWQISTPVVTALVALLFIWLCGDAWDDLGFSRPRTRTMRWITEALVVGLLGQFVAVGILVPAFNALFNIPAASGAAQSSAANFILLLAVGVVNALTKGLAYRAFLLARLPRVFGDSAPGAWLTVASASILFGLSNWHQGQVGILVTAIAGLLFNLHFYWSRRNVWPTILAHAIYNIAALTLLFLGRV